MNSRLEWLDDGETVPFTSNLLDQLEEVVAAHCRKSGIGALYATDIAMTFRDMDDLHAISMLEDILAAKRDARGMVLKTAQRGLAQSDRADELMARLKSREADQENEIIRNAESE